MVEILAGLIAVTAPKVIEYIADHIEELLESVGDYIGGAAEQTLDNSADVIDTIGEQLSYTAEHTMGTVASVAKDALESGIKKVL